jgi:hypothetical protein
MFSGSRLVATPTFPRRDADMASPIVRNLDSRVIHIIGLVATPTWMARLVATPTKPRLLRDGDSSQRRR